MRHDRGMTKSAERAAKTRKQVRRHTSSAPRARGRTLIALAGAAAFAIVAFFFLRPSGGTTVAPPSPYTAPVLGSEAAPVTITEYADFQCPSCGAFFRAVEPRLIADHVKTGKAKIVFKNFAWIGDESHRAAEAAACAGAQGKFWAYHDVLYSNQRGENQGAFTAANLKRFADQVGLDRAAFDACVDGGAYKAAIDADMSEVRALGLNGTPSFTINGQRISGPLDYSFFANAIERKLAGR